VAKSNKPVNETSPDSESPENTSSDNKSDEMTAAQAAELVMRTIKVVGKDKKVTAEHVVVDASEVAGFKDYGDHVIVVTTDGQKLRGNK